MFFNSIKEINRFRKEINKLFTKGVSNIYLSYYWEKIWENWHSQNSDFQCLKKFSPS